MTKNEQNRVLAWRLKLLGEAGVMPGNVAQACRHFGLSRKTFYKWKARYKSHGEAGLCDRPRVPLHSPRATPREVISKIIYLRQRYHFGPRRIAAYLRRFHHLTVARSSVHRILIRHGMNRLPANQKRKPNGRAWKRYEKPQPGHRLQLDVKFLERIPGTGKRLYQFTAIDDCTRIRVLKIYDACNQTSAIRFVDEVIRRLPFRVLVIQTDNGAELQSHFHWHLDEHEFYQLLDKNCIADDIHLFNDKLREWEDYYNYHRPHGALDGQTPYERLLARKTSASVLPKS